MIYDFSLKLVGIVIGILLIASHSYALLNSAKLKSSLVNFPRSRQAGIVLISICAIWAFWLIRTMDMGEYSNLRTPASVAIPIALFLTIRFVDEFLAVRALGILLLLAATPLLEAAFLKPQTSRLLLTVLAYVWAIKGILWVGMPYLMRDQIDWVLNASARWQTGMVAGIGYGIVTLGCALLWY